MSNLYEELNGLVNKHKLNKNKELNDLLSKIEKDMKEYARQGGKCIGLSSADAIKYYTEIKEHFEKLDPGFKVTSSSYRNETTVTISWA